MVAIAERPAVERRLEDLQFRASEVWASLLLMQRTLDTLRQNGGVKRDPQLAWGDDIDALYRVAEKQAAAAARLCSDLDPLQILDATRPRVA